MDENRRLFSSNNVKFDPNIYIHSIYSISGRGRQRNCSKYKIQDMPFWPYSKGLTKYPGKNTFFSEFINTTVVFEMWWDNILLYSTKLRVLLSLLDILVYTAHKITRILINVAIENISEDDTFTNF